MKTTTADDIVTAHCMLGAQTAEVAFTMSFLTVDARVRVSV